MAETGVTRTTVKRMRTRRRQIEEAGLPLPATRKAARNNVLPSDDEVDVIDPAAYEQACQRRDNPKPSLRITIANLFTRTTA
ncbi:hypothetical protein TRM7615_03653 [Falsiruegeria mediterranea M17]|uniref:Uncharacterized protein n=1 Tax=Falsiruegeria mediterranea M17 TaxID=1200281 RepID=A0A2R8CCI8_9RHOB|nr:hypothetical protein TRM7615_03653 [Falsiruegeria mediterranea M17]